MDAKNSLALDYLEKTKDALKEQQDEEVDESSPYYDLIQSLIVSGKTLYSRGDFAGSRSRWEKIRNLFPNNRIAIEYILRCDLKLDPVSFQRFSELIVQNGMDALSSKNTKKALSIFTMIKTISPEYPGIDALIAKSQTVKTKRKVTQTGVEVSQAEIDRRYQLGLSLYKNGGEGNLRAALDNFKWIVGVDPENMKAAINMSKIESQLRIGAAGAEPEQQGPKLTENQKRLVREYYLRGINYYSNNNFEKAIEEWRKVISLDPNNEKAKNNIRKCLALLKK
jgi:tetratricopeptide (TPR) repeat protein